MQSLSDPGRGGKQHNFGLRTVSHNTVSALTSWTNARICENIATMPSVQCFNDATRMQPHKQINESRGVIMGY